MESEETFPNITIINPKDRPKTDIVRPAKTSLVEAVCLARRFEMKLPTKNAPVIEPI